jgi:hypothetical protein
LAKHGDIPGTPLNNLIMARYGQVLILDPSDSSVTEEVKKAPYKQSKQMMMLSCSLKDLGSLVCQWTS